ncbi:MAG: prolipoprotein diacylglyceryl transferase [Chitinophagaceae bacterium]|nr:prolipoprotein diacylglyceryl transferase [Chitinophagaceae bacterium]
MYPNLYYVLNDWFGWQINALKVFYTFGVFVAVAFITAAWVLTREFKRKEKEGLLRYREETIITGKPATAWELAINGLIGFVFGYKLVGAFLASKSSEIDLRAYIFSMEGSVFGGLLIGALLVYLKYREKNKQKLPKPEKRTIRIWPHDRVGDMVVLALVFGLIGAKVFDNLENWDRFIEAPLKNLFSPSGLTFYGGLICAGAAIIWYAKKKGIRVMHLLDAFGPTMMIAYAVGRIGCQVAGDGDWGIYNSAYITDDSGKVVLAQGNDFRDNLEKHETYFLKGAAPTATGGNVVVTDRISATLDDVPHKSFKAPKFLPVWMVAYNYPHNVNEDGVLLPECEGEFCRVLPSPVFPTPFYEIVACLFLFLVLWALRRKIKIPGVLFSIYLIFTGVERFLVETIRVNTKYSFWGLEPTQAELISFILVLAGIIGIIFFRSQHKKEIVW